MQLLGHGRDPGVAASSGENDAIRLTAGAGEGEGGDGGGGGELVGGHCGEGGSHC